jgi:hypothetical protein
LTAATVEVAEQSGAYKDPKPKSKDEEEDENLEERLIMDSLDVRSITGTCLSQPSDNKQISLTVTSLLSSKRMIQSSKQQKKWFTTISTGLPL